MRHAGSSRLRAVSQLARVLAVIAPPLVYAWVFKVYRPWNEDNAWFVSFSRNLCERGIETDAVFGREFPNGMGGTVAFGKLPALVHCALLGPLGWTLPGAYTVSIAVFALTCALCFAYVRGRGWSRARAGFFVATLAILEPFVALANAAKYEFVILFLAMLGLVLHQRGRLWGAAFVATLAIECEPMGIVGWIYLACAELEVGWSWRRAPWLALGLGSGAACILLLHPHFPTQLAALSHGNQDGLRGHFLYPYFFTAKYFRHLPELAIIVWVLGHRLLHGPTRREFGLLASVGVFLAGLISYRANYHYAVLFMFPACLMVYTWLTERAWPQLVFLPALLIMAPQYALVARTNAPYRSMSYLDQVHAIVERAVDPRAPLTVYGHYTSYFALGGLDFHADEMLLLPHAHAPQEVLVCLENATADLPPALSCSELLPRFAGAHLLGTVAYGAHAFDVFMRTQR